MGQLWAAYTHYRSLCGGHLESLYTDISDVAYLGDSWLPEFDELDSQLGATSPAAIGRALPDGVTVPIAQSPSAYDFSRFYPPCAHDQEVPGVADMVCFVRRGLNLYCATLSEEPPGYGFGEATQRIMRLVRVAPSASDGQPTPGLCMRRRVTFALTED